MPEKKCLTPCSTVNLWVVKRMSFTVQSRAFALACVGIYASGQKKPLPPLPFASRVALMKNNDFIRLAAFIKDSFSSCTIHVECENTRMS